MAGINNPGGGIPINAFPLPIAMVMRLFGGKTSDELEQEKENQRQSDFQSAVTKQAPNPASTLKLNVPQEDTGSLLPYTGSNLGGLPAQGFDLRRVIPQHTLVGGPTEYNPTLRDASEPEVHQASLNYLAQGGDPRQLSSMLSTLPSKQGTFKALPSGATYGTVDETGKFTPQGTTPSKTTTPNPNLLKLTEDAANGDEEALKTLNTYYENEAKKFQGQQTAIGSREKDVAYNRGQNKFQWLLRNGDKVFDTYKEGDQPLEKDGETATTKTMQELAPKVLYFVKRIRSMVEDQANNLGPVSGRWREFWQGEIGAPDKNYAKLRTDAMLLPGVLSRMHLAGRGGVQAIEYYKKLLETGKQSPENMSGVLDEIEDYANQVMEKIHPENTSTKVTNTGQKPSLESFWKKK